MNTQASGVSRHQHATQLAALVMKFNRELHDLELQSGRRNVISELLLANLVLQLQSKEEQLYYMVEKFIREVEDSEEGSKMYSEIYQEYYP